MMPIWIPHGISGDMGEPKSHSRIFYGWYIVAGSFTMLFFERQASSIRDLLKIKVKPTNRVKGDHNDKTGNKTFSLLLLL
jgi:hypothetical protein